MPVPTHRADCRTSIWRSTCRYCFAPVFFFSCTCGSKVYFNLNEPPWDPHQDRCFPYLAEQLHQSGAHTGAEIRRLVEACAYETGQSVPAEAYEVIVRMDGQGVSRTEVVDVPPQSEDEDEDVFGIVVEANRNVNFYKRFRLEKNAIIAGLLGRLFREPYVDAVVRTEPDSRNRISFQYTLFVPQGLWDREAVAVKQLVMLSLSAWTVVTGPRIWLARSVAIGKA